MRAAHRERGNIGEVAWERGAAAAAVAGLAPGVKKSRGGARERSLSFIFVLIEFTTTCPCPLDLGLRGVPLNQFSEPLDPLDLICFWLPGLGSVLSQNPLVLYYSQLYCLPTRSVCILPTVPTHLGISLIQVNAILSKSCTGAKERRRRVCRAPDASQLWLWD